MNMHLAWKLVWQRAEERADVMDLVCLHPRLDLALLFILSRFLRFPARIFLPPHCH